MPAYRRVEGVRAGAGALGILVPPGERTSVILRPRPLAWDLLPTPRPGMPFCEFGRDEASAVARRVQSALVEGADARHDPLQAIYMPHSAGYHLAARLADWFWLACWRQPGQAYEPVLFRATDDIEHAGELLAPFLCPAADAEQEYYFNTQLFAR